MRVGLLLILLISAAAFSKQNHALIFADSAVATQKALIEEINQQLFYSPTLRSRINIEVVDINLRGPGFSGSVKYKRDRDGETVAKYRPAALPYVICFVGDRMAYRGHLNNKEQLCICTNHC